MAIKRNCVVCNIELVLPRKKFCSEGCYLTEKSEKAKRRIAMMRRMKPSKECLICGEEFFPLREDHSACSKFCSEILAKKKRKERLAKMKKFGQTKPMETIFQKDLNKHRKIFLEKKIPCHSKLVTTCTFNPSDTTKDYVKAFIESGGQITKYPDSPPNRTPDALPHTRQIREDMTVYGIEYTQEEEIPYVS